MHRLLLLVALALPFLAHAQTPAFGERVGDVLDAEERAYFGLFPDSEGFVEARGTVGRNDTLHVVIEPREGAPTSRTLRPEEGNALRQFIATFEHYPTAYLNPHWQIVSPFADPAVPVAHVDVERPDVIVDADGRRFPGVVLFASDTLLVLQPPGVPYRWPADRAVALRSETVTLVQPQSVGLARYQQFAGLGGALVGLGATETIVVVSGEPFLASGTLANAIAGASLGYVLGRLLWPKPPPPGTYAERRRDLHEQARFGVVQPYDLPPLGTLLAQAETYPAEAVPPDAPAVSLLKRWRRTYGWVSIGVLGPGQGHVTDQGEVIVFDEFFVNRQPDQIQSRSGLRNTFGIETGLDVSLRPIPWLRVGATWLRSESPEENVHTEESAFMTPGSVRGYAEVIVPSPRFRGFGVDLALGMGIESNRVVVSRTTSGTGRPTEFRVEEEGSNRFLQGTLELFASARTSFFARYTRRDLPTLSVGPLEERTLIDDLLIYEASAHEVAFGYSELTWGTRFHF